MSKWTDEEVSFLKFAYGNKDFTIDEICNALNRSRCSVKNKVWDLGIHKIEKKEVISISQKQCSRCKEVKDASLFYKNRKSKDGLKSYCKECSKIYENNYRTKSLLENGWC